MKILFLTYFTPKDLKEQTDRLKQAGHEVEFYDCHIDKSEEFRFKNRHFQMYEKVLDYADEKEFDILYLHDYLNVPEFLLAELKVRPHFSSKIVFSMQMREANRSLMRAQTIKELLDMPQIAHAMTFSMGLTDYPYPPRMVQVGTNFKKLKNLGEPFNEDPNFNITKSQARAHFGIDQNAFIVLWSGRWVFSKGADLFIEASKYIDKDILIVAHQNPTEMDFNIKVFEELKQNHPNTKLIIDLFKKGDMKYVYSVADIAVCSHRRIYEYSQSGVPGMAALAGVPIVAPNFNYFSEIINRYRVGTLYEPENIEAMVEAIKYTRIHYDEIIKNAEFKRSVEGYINFEDIPLLAIEGI
jgi:glycosyltransferase involved in cell wall biosynthesis